MVILFFGTKKGSEKKQSSNNSSSNNSLSNNSFGRNLSNYIDNANNNAQFNDKAMRGHNNYNSYNSNSAYDTKNGKANSLDRDILSYIKKELSKGYSLEQIREALLAVGHDVEKVNAHISKVKSELPAYISGMVVDSKFLLNKKSPKLKKASGKSQASLKKDIINYITNELKKGYSLKKIEKALLDAGHHPEFVRLHIEHVEELEKTKGNIKSNLYCIKSCINRIKSYKGRAYFLVLLIILLLSFSFVIFFWPEKFFSGLTGISPKAGCFGNSTNMENSTHSLCYDGHGHKGSDSNTKNLSCGLHSPYLCNGSFNNTKLVSGTAGLMENVINEKRCKAFSGKKRDLCFYILANQAANQSYCLALSNKALKGKCLFNLAIVTQNETLCSRLPDEDLNNKETGLTGLAKEGQLAQFFQEAIQEAQLTNIAQLTNMTRLAKENCYKIVAVGKLNLGLCNKIADESLRNSCKKEILLRSENITDCSAFAGNSSFAGNIFAGNSLYFQCVLGIAEKTLNISLCKKLPQQIRDNCIIILASKLKNSRLCDDGLSDSLKLWCYESSGFAKENTTIALAAFELCSIIKNKTNLTKSYESCIADIAVKRRNLSVCFQIQNASKRDDCIYNTALSINSIKACSFIINSYTKDWCMAYIAKEKENITICYGLAYEDSKASCISMLAEKLKSRQLCEKLAYLTAINASMAKDLCLKDVAIAAKDKAICSSIKDSNLQSQCYSLT